MNLISAPAAPGTPVVLYVDDDRQDLKLMKLYCQEEDFHLIEGSSPSNVLDYIKDLKNPLDLLIADLRMPDIDGRQLVAQAKMYRPNLPTVGVTRYPDSTECKEFKAITDRFFEKTSDLYSAAAIWVHNALTTIDPKPPRSALVTRVINKAMQNWYGVEPNNVHVSPELMDDPNFQEFMLQKDVLEILYPGQYVAFTNGKFIDHDADREALLDRVYKSNEEPVDVFIQKLKKPRIVHLRTPQKVNV